ncbi:hypothetical protein [Flavobacterium hungaricum]|uniref:Uncharacterized protein n=1 Tax=Flavobacterium hungaricum TaxID=2082725 RepID=A0ABR9TRJ6_9FLAO|nr:hypothetical protein [Flavobacterium hungaricum]MBE8727252.1 hypothetical protein [Flavobacterium hungaricum]
MQEKSNQSGKKVNTVLLIAVGIAIVLVVLFQFYLSHDAKETNTEINELVEKYNKNCPLRIQEGIQLDSVSLPKERRVQYNLTLLNVEKETAEVEIVQEEIRKSLISTAKANPGLQIFREKDFILIYHYNDKKKAFLFDIEVFPYQYK